MVNTAKLRGKMAEQNVEVQFLGTELGISRQAMSDKLNGRINFSLNDVHKISEVLNLTSEDRDLIFFSEIATNSCKEEE